MPEIGAAARLPQEDLPVHVNPKTLNSPKDVQNLENPESLGFRFKRAARIAFLTLAAVFGAVVIGAGIAAFVCNPPGAAIVAVVATSILLGLVAVKLFQLITPYLPNWLRVPLNYVQSFVCGLASAIALAILFPLDLQKRNPKKEECDPNQTPILMIHGFLGSSNNWVYHRHRMQKAGFKNLFSINLGNPFKSIDQYADQVHKMVQEIKRKTGRDDLQIVAHSMGGLVARHYNQKYAEQDGVKVKDIVTLGTPLDGTRVAWMTMGMSKSGREMFHKSGFVKKQQENAQKMNVETRHYHLASKCDYVIRPLVSATKGNGHRTTTEWLDATGHISYLFSDTAADKIIQYLKLRRNREEPRVRAA